VARLVEVFREVRRVLNKDGTVFLNLGDSYNAQPGQRKSTDAAGPKQLTNEGAQATPSRAIPGLKPKDLIGIPWMTAFALRADGWYLRQDLIWSKPNPMPESVTDRCTKAHEYLFLLSKSATYYYDHEAIKERSITCDPRKPYTSQGAWDLDGRPNEQRHGGEPRSFNGSKFNTGKTAEHQLGRASGKPRTSGNKTNRYVTEYEGSDSEEHRTKAGLLKISDVPWELRNKRSVWTVAADPFPDAHFAVFPPALITPCVLAGSPENGVILDPFCGSGTSGEVALRCGRNFIGIDLSAEYIEMSRRRVAGVMPMFAQEISA
jgi:DNA modification methylase